MTVAYFSKVNNLGERKWFLCFYHFDCVQQSGLQGVVCSISESPELTNSGEIKYIEMKGLITAGNSHVLGEKIFLEIRGEIKTAYKRSEKIIKTSIRLRLRYTYKDKLNSRKLVGSTSNESHLSSCIHLQNFILRLLQ